MALSTQIGFVQGHTYLTLQQTDASATHGQSAACSGGSLTSDTGNDILISPGGTAGSSDRTITVAAGSTEAALFFESTAIGYTKWDAGVWKIQITLTGDNGDMFVRGIYVCRVNSSGVSQETVASSTETRSLEPAGSLLWTVVQENTITAAATDRVYIVVLIENVEAAPEEIEITPNARIYTPIKTAVHVRSRKQRARGRSGLTVPVTATVNAPTVAHVLSVAPPTVAVNVVIPTQIGIAPPYTLPDPN